MSICWTDEEDYLAKHLIGQGQTDEQVAVQVNRQFHDGKKVRTNKAVWSRRTKRFRIRRGHDQAPEAEIKVMTQLLDKGLTASQAARAMGRALDKDITRNTVIGRANRRDIPLQNKPAEDRSRPSQRFDDVSGGLVPEDRKKGLQCRFPHGNPKEPDFHFCDKPRVHESYCDEHQKLTHQRTF